MMNNSPLKKTNHFIKDLPFILLGLPVVIYLFIFNYLPLFGVIIAFKDYNYRQGILGSPWCGFKNFEYFFTSQDALRTTRNTILYSVGFHIIGTVCSVFVALMLYELRGRIRVKVYHTSMLLPYFVSWVIAAYIVNALLDHSNGVFNHVLGWFNIAPVNWYTETKYWPLILLLCDIWKNIGMSCVLYYANLMALDPQFFEAAALDGANRFKQIWHVSVPSLVPMICILSIMKVGGILSGDFGLFYQVPMNVGALYPVTDIIPTYIFRGLTNSTYSASAAVGLFQSVVGCMLVLLTNAIVRKVDDSLALV